MVVSGRVIRTKEEYLPSLQEYSAMKTQQQYYTVNDCTYCMLLALCYLLLYLLFAIWNGQLKDLHRKDCIRRADNSEQKMQHFDNFTQETL